MRELDMTYTQYINFQIKSQFENYHHSVFYGQNIVAGSRISGLGAGLENVTGASAINTTNWIISFWNSSIVFDEAARFCVAGPRSIGEHK